MVNHHFVFREYNIVTRVRFVSHLSASTQHGVQHGLTITCHLVLNFVHILIVHVNFKYEQLCELSVKTKLKARNSSVFCVVFFKLFKLFLLNSVPSSTF